MHHPHKGKWLLLSAVLMAVLVLPSAFAQETTTGLTGVVKDPSGAVIANASVEVSGPALIGIRKAETDGGGNYRFGALPNGVYTLIVTAPGFRKHRQVGIELLVGRLPSIDVQMEVGAVAEVVEVTAAAPMVDVTQSKVAKTVEHEILQNVPKGRSFQSLIPFAPGARQEPMQSSGDRSNGFQIDGASDGENVYLIDGMNTTNIQNGGVGKNFQIDFVEEVQIKSSSFEAEHGGALGGVINAVPKKGSNNWHGEVKFYWQSYAMNANNADRGLRTNPLLPSLNTTTRLDATPEYYYGAKDQRNILEPGYEIGGPLFKDKLWFFSGYVPTHDTTRRTTSFTGSNPGPRTLNQTFTQHNMYNRLDYGAFNQLRVFGAWNYGYSRITGTLGGQDSAARQRNTGASTDPNTLRADAGSVNPLQVFTFGGDWTPTSKLVVSTRYGYFFNNNGQRGTPIGTRYVYQATVNAANRDLANQAFPAASFNTSGFANIPSNLATIFDAYKRKQLNVDASYFAHFYGTHNLKVGFFWQEQSNEVLRNLQGGSVNLFWGQSYSPVTSTSICDQIKAQNVTTYGAAANQCQGRFGYFSVGNTVTNTGTAAQSAKAFYFQDSWNVGHGLTLNLGVRFDQETTPAYDPKRFPTLEFGWGDKIAPRIGAAYDLFRNGKVKVYGSYGKFYDLQKMGLARGSFGSDYWHNCVYAMDDANFAGITPTLQLGGGCPATGPAPGVTGRFIENVDFRATKADPRDPAVQPDMKPMEQHEFVTGVDWAITPSWSLETRWARKRLDRTIEDMAITDNLGFYIGNPGTTYGDVLHRPVVIPNAAGVDYQTTVQFCAECPKTVPAIRRYDSVEFRLAKRQVGKWFGAITYAWSRNTGNYAGLTNTDRTDGGGGRHAPNNHRAFDIPTMTYLPSGKIDDGVLGTDRPHTASAFGFYRQKWFGMESRFGFTQSMLQGTPISTCLPVVGTSSACQWAEGRGNFVSFTRAANGDFVKGNVKTGARTDPFYQTDITVNHDIHVKEGQTLGLELNVTNLFNHRSPTAHYQFAIPTNLINPARAARFSGDLEVDFGKVMNGYNYVDALNGTGAFAGNVAGTRIQTPLTVASRYGLPDVFQNARQLRVVVRYTF